MLALALNPETHLMDSDRGFWNMLSHGPLYILLSQTDLLWKQSWTRGKIIIWDFAHLRGGVYDHCDSLINLQLYIAQVKHNIA